MLLLMAVRSASRHQALFHEGAAGLLLKEAPVQVVLKQLRQCARTETGAPDSTGTALVHAGPLADVHRRRIAGLSGRERDIVRLIGEGLRNEQIAGRIGISEKTVRNQLSSLFDKLGVNDRLGLAIYAFEHGLLHLQS
jgi:DNA-binding NarL/FixJ family response regulator